jgi:hypothetical protein
MDGFEFEMEMNGVHPIYDLDENIEDEPDEDESLSGLRNH